MTDKYKTAHKFVNVDLFRSAFFNTLSSFNKQIEITLPLSQRRLDMSQPLKISFSLCHLPSDTQESHSFSR